MTRLELVTLIANWLWAKGDTDRASEFMREAILLMMETESFTQDLAPYPDFDAEGGKLGDNVKIFLASR